METSEAVNFHARAKISEARAKISDAARNLLSGARKFGVNWIVKKYERKDYKHIETSSAEVRDKRVGRHGFTR